MWEFFADVLSDILAAFISFKMDEKKDKQKS